MANDEPNIDKVGAVTDLLLGTDSKADDPGTGDGSPTAGQPDAAPEPGEAEGDFDFTPAAIAERLGVKPNELFDGLRIPVDGGDAMTLEEFKDAGQELRTVRSAQNELAEQRITFENETMLQRQTIQAAISKLPKDAVTPAVLDWLQDQHQQYVATERRALVAVRPDLADSKKWDGVRELLITHLMPYGFRDIEVDAIIDHRLAKYVIDNAEREQRIRELEATVEKGGKPLQRPTGQPAKTGRKRRDSSKRRTGPKVAATGRTTRADKVAQVAELLGEQ